MIDPLEAVIAYLDSQPTLTALVEGRIAPKHKFAMTGAGGWPTPAKAVLVRVIPGAPPDLYGGTARVRLEARCFGDGQVEAMEVYRALMDVVGQTKKCVVTLSNDQKALLYFLVPEYGSPEFGMDPDVKVDVALTYLRASVAQQAVP